MKKRTKKHVPDPEYLSEEERLTWERSRVLFKTLRQETFSVAEKDALRSQVDETISRRKQRTLRTFWLAAAAFTLLLLAGMAYRLFYQDSVTAMQQLAARTQVPGEETRLILADQRSVTLQKKQSSLVYRENGALIQVDSSSTIGQQVAGAPQFNALIVPYGKRSVLTLSDGTRIWLNSGSKLVYPSHFDHGRREVYLEGQAYFSVAHDEGKPFLVHSKDMEVKVLGTEFDISAYRDDPYTAAVLTRGSVELTTGPQTVFGSKKTKLTPGTRAVFEQNGAVLHTLQVDVKEYIAWKDGNLFLNSAPFAGILKQLSRYYRVDIDLKQPKLVGVTFDGTLALQDDVRDVLKALSYTTGLSYKQLSNERRYVLEESTIKP